MSKKLSYRGQLPIGEQDRIRLKTKNGKKGYKITKFQIISSAPGTGNFEYVAKIFKDDQTGSITSTINFTDGTLLAAVYNSDSNGWGGNLPDSAIIFDNEIVNQDIFINITDASGATIPCNYFIELEVMDLSDLEATQVTLKSLRTLAE
jgi:hypothetical protein